MRHNIDQMIIDKLQAKVICKNFEIAEFIIDVLAYDHEERLLVIQYDWIENESIIDQALDILHSLRESKLDIQNHILNPMKNNDILKSFKTRILFVTCESSSQLNLQLRISDKVPVKIWQVLANENDTVNVSIHYLHPGNSIIFYEEMRTLPTSIWHFNRGSKIDLKEGRIFYTEQYHLNRSSSYVTSLYYKLKSTLVETLEDINIVPVKHWLDVYKGSYVLLSVIIRTDKLIVTFRGNITEDRNYLSKFIAVKRRYGVGKYQMNIVGFQGIEFLMELLYLLDSFENLSTKEKNFFRGSFPFWPDFDGGF